MMKRIQNAIVERGYVTTRVLAQPQDLNSWHVAANRHSRPHSFDPLRRRRQRPCHQVECGAGIARRSAQSARYRASARELQARADGRGGHSDHASRRCRRPTGRERCRDCVEAGVSAAAHALRRRLRQRSHRQISRLRHALVRQLVHAERSVLCELQQRSGWRRRARHPQLQRPLLGAVRLLAVGFYRQQLLLPPVGRRGSTRPICTAAKAATAMFGSRG